ncbi:NAD(P)H-dependent glycerol-3-phosphate dehydrogenase [Weissella diestrammenae]|uniref:Glycerol-3-phosphate dehydrogenase [NAD(P)+] n=1 Tax=Weissella diestrammenae TaxID=1162633 RepID=A0A7G9T6B3_9LACO|nr:NAD(P)H-dependent glycerol-3-phosphate dehydrogenase [Weissella diestrammenae]MCM0583316.1 NAD(P)H-dependent glycerol-3-phosphate dehydrogenase [Weissella diestrammenae]QNN75638.1 NAD(P)H-dependent glycerol-3-phosphate dehydrogenase [Weissella diestrammenae]
MSKKTIAVLGAGSWGTALANVVAENGHDVRLWAHRKETVDEINKHHMNKRYLGDRVLQASIVATDDMQQAIDGATIILSVVPTKATREVAGQLNQALSALAQSAIVVTATKGLEPKTYQLATEIIADEIDAKWLNGLAAIAGPSHAEGVIKHDPTLVTVASQNQSAAQQVQAAFSNSSFRVYTNDDLVGSELAGALKNVVAIAAGALQSLGYDDNAKAALFTRGLAEIARLGAAFGADEATFMGLAGVGDLFATATSIHSRNYRAGLQLGEGKSMDEVIAHMGMVIEGISTTKVVHELAAVKGVEMPIANAIYQVIYKGQAPKDAIKALMDRPLHHEGK